MANRITEKSQQAASNNPFYKMGGTLTLLQQGLKLTDDATEAQVSKLLGEAWKECSQDGNKIKRELFFVLVFSLGDLSNRDHNLFKKKGITDPDKGGQSKRKVFAYCLKWILENVPEQFYAFLPIIGEYYNLDGTMLYEIRTDRWKGTLKETLHLPIDVQRVTDYVAGILSNPRTTENEKKMWARWLPHVPSRHRIRRYEITEKNIKAFVKGGYADVKIGDTVRVVKDKKDHTRKKDGWMRAFIKVLSEKMGWKIIAEENKTIFQGYEKYKKNLIQDTEAVLFSTGKIREYDKTQFLEWLDRIPSGARFRVSCRIASKTKDGKLEPKTKWFLKSGENMGQVYIDWLSSKSKAQEKLSSLTIEEKKGMDQKELKSLEKSAKVNTGGDTLLDAVCDVLGKRTSVIELDTKAFSLLEKIRMDVPVLTVVDISGSMGSAALTHKGIKFVAKNVAQLATTLFLLKNPDEEMSNLFIRFGTDAEVVYKGTKLDVEAPENRFMSQRSVVVDAIVDKTKPFSTNFVNVSSLIPSSHGSTDIGKVAKRLKEWVDQEPAFSSQRIDQINKYQVILVVSDGNFNSYGNPMQSVVTFQQDMRQWFGWEGVIVVWDVSQQEIKSNEKFDGSNNIVYFGGFNPSILDQVFRNIGDMDVVDQYIALKAIYESNRYGPVKELVL